MGRISDSQKEQIRQRVALEELLPDYNVQLIPAGRQFKALCPFHREKTPSFWIDPDKQLYHCYGCQEGGDVFRFVQTLEGVGWIESLRLLARRAGVVLEEDDFRSEDGGLVELYDANRTAADFYHRVLLSDPRAEQARQYLRDRGIDESMWQAFEIGYSLPEWDAFLTEARKRSIQPKTLERAGLIRARSGRDGFFDYFRGRLMFPITDAQGRVQGFGGRTLGDDEPKYLNTAKTVVFDKSQVLYGIQRAKVSIRQSRYVTIVEGYTDVIAAHQAGLETFVASLGTAFTEENAKQLHRMAPRVRMIFDGDAAGQKALERSLDLLVSEELDVNIYTVSDGKDPCDAVLALGGEEFERLIERDSLGIFDFKWRASVESLGPNPSATELARGIDECLSLVLKVPNAVTQQLIIRKLAERAFVSERELHGRLAEVRSRKPRDPGRGGDAGRGGDPVRVARPEENDGAEDGPLSELAETVIACLVAQPEKARERWAEVPLPVFTGALGREVIEIVEQLISENSFSGEALIHRSRRPELAPVVTRLLHLGIESDDEEAALDRESTWRLCLRDLARWRIRTRIGELDRLIQSAQQEGDGERVTVLRRERMDLKKQARRQRAETLFS